MKYPLRPLFCSCLLTLLLAGCGDASWRTHDITNLMPGLAFTLTGETGNSVDAERFAGRVTGLYFGFSHCRRTCPVTLALLKQALLRLGPEADEVRILFVSVDPARDTPARLARYTAAFGPRFVGLTGTQAQLDALTRRYRVSYGYGKADAQGAYPVYHSSGIFVFDRAGRARLLMQTRDGAKAIAVDLRRLLEN